MPRPAHQLLALFGLGALIGTAADQIHVQSGVLSYARPTPLLIGQAPWVPLLFGAAGVVLPLGNAVLLRLLRDRTATGSGRALASSVLWFFAAYASTAAFQAWPLLLAPALALAWGARVAVSSAPDRAIAGPLLAVGGSLFEAGLSSTGAFQYLHPDLLFVPAWLPALYLHASLMTREACLAFLAPARARSRPPALPR
jgi:hypothetical protein